MTLVKNNNWKLLKVNLLLLVFLSLFKTGCQKADVKTEAPVAGDATVSTYFEGLPSESPLLAKVAAELKKQNKNTGLINNLSKKYGFLKWDKSMVTGTVKRSFAGSKTDGELDTIIVIPLLEKGSKTVSSYIQAEVGGDSVTLDLYTANKYSKLSFSSTATQVSEAEKYAMRFMLLNKDVFGHTEFFLNDNRLFNNTGKQTDTSKVKRYVSLTSKNSGSNNIGGKMVYKEVCVDIITSTSAWVCGTPGYEKCNDADGCDQCGTYCPYVTTSTTNTVCDGWWADDGSGLTGGGGTTTTGGGGTGSTGGGGTTTTDPCLVSRIIAARLPCPGDGGTGWVPVVSDQYTADEKELNLSDTDPNLQWWDSNVSDPNTNYDSQTRPSFTNMNANYPKNDNGTDDMPVSAVCSLIGGQVLTKYNNGDVRNGCALRMSRALNYSGVNIPTIPGQTWQGADGKNYFYYAQHLYNWMTKAFGQPDIHLTEGDGAPNGTNFKNKLIGIQNRGIYIMRPKSQATFGASGHATLWGGLDCIGGHNYFAAASDVYVWKLN